jgi:hypothetical protein
MSSFCLSMEGLAVKEMRVPMRSWFKLTLIVLLLASMIQMEAATDEPWIYQIILKSGEGIIDLPDTPEPPRIFFLQFGNHSFEPDSIILERQGQKGWEKTGDKKSILIGQPLPVGLFQELRAVPWSVPVELHKKGIPCRFRVKRNGGVNGRPARDMFWDQIIAVNESVLTSENMNALRNYELVESGNFGEALPAHIRAVNYSSAEIERLKECLTDPVMDILKESPGKEISRKELESKALPLDYQKILLSGINDPDPGFAYQNGQWFVTWPGSDGTRIQPEWNKKKDIWFAPAVRFGNEIIRPAPLSAKTGFLKSKSGRTLPMFIIEWILHSPDGRKIKVTQTLFSEIREGIPQIFIHFKMEDPPRGAHFVLGQGKRPYAHYWDDPIVDRTPIPYFTSYSKLNKKTDHILTDETGSVILCSSLPVQVLHEGISEALLEFDAMTSELFITTPQVRTENLFKPLTRKVFLEASRNFMKKWNKQLSEGAHAVLPSAEWNQKIDSWLTQINSITRIYYNGKERLSYGAYFYKDFFGVEEGWASVAFAQWGEREEAKRQCEILLSGENLDKTNYHHQYRNGLSSWYSASVARLTGDKDWLRSISPALIANGYWTINARIENDGGRSLLGKGLLPSHIYGGDVSTPAYSLYASGTCLRGLIETADVFKRAELNEMQADAEVFTREACNFRKRLDEVMGEVIMGSPPLFLPLALELNQKAGNNEGPYYRLTDEKLGNYWNLFASLFLHLGILQNKDPVHPSEWITDYLENHGGLFAGLPRFYSGLDAVYAIGYIDELLERSRGDMANRAKALAALESFMIHASSQNGHTVPEVSGFFPERLDRKEYERVVREAPWNFGMYMADRYLQGFSSFTEPLGAGAGEGLWLIRKSLVDEGKDENGLPDGSIFFLCAAPGEWLKEGKEIRLSRFPTAYGTFDLKIKSSISSKREIHVKYNYSRVLGKDRTTGKNIMAWNKLDKILIRLVPPREDFDPDGKLHVKQPLGYIDNYTIQVPVKRKGNYVIKF